MRTSDRTYTQRLAFDDSDRKSDLHDQACLYLAQDAKCRKLVETFIPLDKVLLNAAYKYRTEFNSDDLVALDVASDPASIVSVAAKLSDPLRASNSTIPVGYADLVAKAVVSRGATERRRNAIKKTWQSSPDEPKHGPEIATAYAVNETYLFLVEVKSQRTPITNCIQQLNFYRRLKSEGFQFGPDLLILATLYPLVPIEQDALGRENILHIYLCPSTVRAAFDGSATP